MACFDIGVHLLCCSISSPAHVTPRLYSNLCRPLAQNGRTRLWSTIRRKSIVSSSPSLPRAACSPPPVCHRIQKLTEDFLNAPLGQQDVGLNAYLRQKDPDEIMLNLGMALSGDAAGGAALLASGSPSEKPLVPEGAPATCNGRDSTNSLIETPLSDISKPYYEPGSSGLPMVSLPEHAGSANDFNFLIRTLAAHGRCQEARARVVPEMRRRGVRLDGRTYSALLAGTAIDRNSAAAEEVCRKNSVP